MFLIHDTPFRYRDPWEQSLNHRLARLKRGTPRIAYYYDVPDDSTFRYRVYNMIQAIDAADGNMSASYFCLADLDHNDDIINSCDCVVVCRSRYGPALSRFIAKAKARGRKVFFDIDDFIFDARYAHLILNVLDHNLDLAPVAEYWFSYMSRVGETLRLCDHAIVTNEFLAERVRAFNDMPISIIPNFLNLEQSTASDAIYAEKKARKFARDDTIHIGYFSGSPTHNRDFAIIADTLRRLLREDPRLVLRVVGYFEMPDSLREQQDRIEVHPLQDFVNLQRLIGSTEINLIPLQDNIFTNCKSDLKYFEAGIVGSISVASRTGMLGRAIQDGVTGHLANTLDWADRIGAVIDAIDDYAEMAEAAHDHVRDTYHWSRQVDAIERVLTC